VGHAGAVSTDAAVALHVFSRKPWGVGVDHGLRPTTDRMQVTRAAKNVVHEIDGRPAFEVYREHAAKRGTALTPEAAGSFLIGNELGISFFAKLHRARAPLASARTARSPARARSRRGRPSASSTASPTAWWPPRAARPRRPGRAWATATPPRCCSST